jgi:hypothetical protein
MIKLEILLGLPWLATVLAIPNPQGTNCPETCVAQLTQNTTGTQPAGITFTVTPGTVKNGRGRPECESTCEVCSAVVTVAFNGNGVFCMTYDQGPGWSTPVDEYARSGLLRSRCADPTPAFSCFRIGADCTTLPGAYVFESCWLLDCQCPF